MSSSIKLFQFIQKFHRAIGVFPSQFNSNHLISKIWFICAAQTGLTTGAFLLFAAQSMMDYGFGFCVLITVINAIIFYSSFIWQSKNTTILFENCEKFIETSKLTKPTIYLILSSHFI